MIPLKDNLKCLLFPWATFAIIALNCLAYVLELSALSTGSPEHFINTYLMVPGRVVEAFASGDPSAIAAAAGTIFSSMFLHDPSGLAHLLGNMLYLFVFGRAMEARLGRVKFIGFYLLSGIAAAFVHIWSDPASMVPTLGASGAIAGVLGGYLMLWPKATIVGFVPLPTSARGYKIPFTAEARAYWYILFWIFAQFTSVLGPASGGGGVAYWAHIGGFIFGFILCIAVRIWQPTSDVCYIPEEACTPCEKPHLDDADGSGENASK
ncbi:MAG TPA: rhomboid family intramembrane serine protease [Candidatus Obscuribacterales bacterium]